MCYYVNYISSNVQPEKKKPNIITKQKHNCVEKIVDFDMKATYLVVGKGENSPLGARA
jgi:hypothetical protein